MTEAKTPASTCGRTITWPFSRPHWENILVLTLVGAILRLLWWWYARVEPVSDFEEYRLCAENLLDNGVIGFPGYMAWRLPGYPLTLAGLMLISRSTAFLSFSSVIMSSGLVPLVYLLVLRLVPGNKPVVIGTTLFVAVGPSYVLFAPVLASEHPYCLLLFGTWILLHHSSRSVLRPILTGVLMSVAILTRGMALFYIPICAWVLITDTNTTLKRRAVYAFIFLIATAPLLGLWVLRNRIVVGPGAGLSTTSGYTLMLAHNPWHDRNLSFEKLGLAHLNELQRNREGRRIGMEYIRTAPLANLYQVMRNTKMYYYPNAYAVHWSTLDPGEDPLAKRLDYKNIPGRTVLTGLCKFTWMVLFGASCLCLFCWRYIPGRTWGILVGVIAINWSISCVLFAPSSRYVYVPSIFMCLLCATVICCLVQANSSREQGPTQLVS